MEKRDLLSKLATVTKLELQAYDQDRDSCRSRLESRGSIMTTRSRSTTTSSKESWATFATSRGNEPGIIPTRRKHFVPKLDI